MRNHDAVIKSIVNEYHWPPNVIGRLYCDDLDYRGLLFWYENIKELHEKIPNSSK